MFCAFSALHCRLVVRLGVRLELSRVYSGRIILSLSDERLERLTALRCGAGRLAAAAERSGHSNGPGPPVDAAFTDALRPGKRRRVARR